MRLFARQQFAHLALFATLARCTLACGADTDHAPPIGSPTPTGPIVEQGGGSPSGGGSTGRPGDGLGGGAATIGTSGNPATLGTGGDASFAGNGSGGDNTFGSGGSATARRSFRRRRHFEWFCWRFLTRLASSKSIDAAASMLPGRSGLEMRSALLLRYERCSRVATQLRDSALRASALRAGSRT